MNVAVNESASRKAATALALDPLLSPARGPKMLTDNFDVIAESAGGVLRLRRLVLGLALTGGLSGLRRGEGEECRVAVPSGWRRVTVGNVADCVLGKMLDKSKHTRGTKRPYLRNINVRWGSVDLSDLREMFFEDRELDRYGVLPGDILICEGGEPGRAAIWTTAEPVLIQKAIHRVRPTKDVLPAWLVLNLRYDTWTGHLDKFFTGATIKHFTGKALESYEILLPPLAEQKRIVAKVDQLMALCDELEARQTKKRETSTRLTKSALHALTTADGPEEFDVAWKRVVENFDVLVDRAEKVGELRNTILDLAVHGQLLGATNARRTDGPFQIPATWDWASGDGAFAFVTSGSRGWAEFYSSNGPTFLRIGNLDYQSIALDLREVQHVRPPSNAEGTRTRVQPGDVLVSITGDTGMVGLVPPGLGEAYINQHIALCRPAKGIAPEYVAYALTAPSLLGRLQSAQRGIKNSLGLEDMRNIKIPVPPHDEQKRIVQAIEHFMRMCDNLEARFIRAEERASRLAEVVVQESLQ